MESIVLMNSKWGNDIFIPMYLFFGGLTGGLFIVAVVADLIGIKYKAFENLSKVAAFIALPVLVFAGLFITFHLGKPERGTLFPFFFTNYKSWMVIGGWSVGLAVPIVAGYAALWFFRINQALRRLLGVIGVPLLGFVSFYTGLLLSGAKFVPLWSQKYLPTLFLNSGVLTGMAGAGLMFVFSGSSSAPAPRKPVEYWRFSATGCWLRFWWSCWKSTFSCGILRPIRRNSMPPDSLWFRTGV